MASRQVVSAAALAALLAFTSCDPPGAPDPGPTTGPDGGGGSGGTPTGGTPSGGTPSGGGAPSGGGGSPGGSPAPFTISFDPTGAPAGVDRVELELNAVALFTGAPSYRNEDTRCDGAGAGSLADARTTVTLPFPGTGPVPAVRFDRPAGDTRVAEVWLVFRQGLLHTAERSYKIHAAALCTMPDGMQYTLVRLRPGAPFSIGQGSTDDLVIPFDAGQQVRAGHVDCRTSDAEECRTTDDSGDDADPNTRLRFALPTELPVRVAPAGG